MSLTILLLVVPAMSGRVPASAGTLLGLRIGAEEREVRTALSKIGTGRELAEIERERERAEEGETAVWTMRSGEFKTVVARFSKDRLTMLTAYAKPDAKMQFSDLGEIQKADHQTQNAVYWNIKSEPWPYRLVVKGANQTVSVAYMISLSPTNRG